MTVTDSKYAPKRLKIKEHHLEADEFANLRDSLRGACLSETMGPNWKHLFWFANRVYVRK